MNDPWFTARQRPRNWKGWLLIAVGLVALSAVVGWLDAAHVRGPGFGVAIGVVVSPIVGLMLLTSERPKP